jgi:hypothetical protein
MIIGRRNIFMKKMILSFALCGALLPVHALESARASLPINQTIVTAAQVNGTWRNGRNEFRIWALGGQRLQVEFSGVSEFPPGVSHVGEDSGIARIEGDTATFGPQPEGVEECSITMRFTRGRLVVTQNGRCGYGHNVSAEGTYRRVSASRPRFGEFDRTRCASRS